MAVIAFLKQANEFYNKEQVKQTNFITKNRFRKFDSIIRFLMYIQ